MRRIRAVAAAASGSITALRGREKLVRVAADAFRVVLPPESAARTHTGADGSFELRLAPGDYVLVGRYDEFPSTTTRLSITVPTATKVRRNLPDLCK